VHRSYVCVWSDTFILLIVSPATFKRLLLNNCFNGEGDKIQLHGTSKDYQLVNVGAGEALLQKKQTGRDVIGFFLGNYNLDLKYNISN